MAYDDSSAEALPQPDIEADELPVEGGEPVYAERAPMENMLEQYGLERDLGTAQTQLASLEEREHLIEEIGRRNPDVNGDAPKALESIRLNAEELQKKETFLETVYKFPVRHPFITGVAALYAAYQFGFKLPGAIERAMSAVPLDKMKDIIQSIGPMGGAVGQGPAGMMPSVPGAGVG